MASKVALILGYGARVGADVARSFASKGYKIAVVSRSDKHPSATPDYLYLQADLSDPFSVQGVFTEVKKQLGAPSVVVYNGMPTKKPPPQLIHKHTSKPTSCSAGADTVKQAEPLDEDILAFQSDFNVNTVSAWVAARLAIGSFISLGEDVSGTFIYTGNKLNFIIVPPLLSNGVGKSATAHIIKYAAEKFKDTNHKYVSFPLLM